MRGEVHYLSKCHAPLPDTCPTDVRTAAQTPQEQLPPAPHLVPDIVSTLSVALTAPPWKSPEFSSKALSLIDSLAPDTATTAEALPAALQPPNSDASSDTLPPVIASTEPPLPPSQSVKDDPPMVTLPPGMVTSAVAAAFTVAVTPAVGMRRGR